MIDIIERINIKEKRVQMLCSLIYLVRFKIGDQHIILDIKQLF